MGVKDMQLKKYEMVRILGTGTFGQAWLAIHQDSGKNVVIKRINVFKVPQKEVEQALMEVAILGKLRHINIVKYKDSFVADHQLSIVMEFADAGDLHDKIANQKGQHFKENEIVDWFVQMMFALRYIHSRHILHRDLKTQNIFVTSRNVIKLGDFGIAKVLQDTTDMAVTTIGTPYYMSPEICRQQAYNYKSDIWAAGCVLYELCHLKVPFNAANITELVVKILSGKYPPPPKMYGPILEDLIRALLRLEPTDRPSADQVICIPILQPYIDSYIQQCRLIIRGSQAEASDRRVSQVGEKRHVQDVASTPQTTGATPKPHPPPPTPHVTPRPVSVDISDLGCRAPKSHRLAHQRSQSTNSDHKPAAPPKCSIYKELLKKRGMSVNNAHRRSSSHNAKPQHKPVKTDSNNSENHNSSNSESYKNRKISQNKDENRHLSQNKDENRNLSQNKDENRKFSQNTSGEGDSIDDDVFSTSKGDNNPESENFIEVKSSVEMKSAQSPTVNLFNGNSNNGPSKLTYIVNKPAKFTYKVETHSLNSIKTVIEKQKRNSETYTVNKGVDRKINDDGSTENNLVNFSGETEIHNDFCAALFETWRNTTQVGQVSMETLLLGHLDKEIGHRRVMEVRNILLSAVASQISFEDVVKQMTPKEVGLFPLFMHSVMLNNLC